MQRLDDDQITTVMSRLQHNIEQNNEHAAVITALALMSSTVRAVHDIATALEDIANSTRMAYYSTND